VRTCHPWIAGLLLTSITVKAGEVQTAKPTPPMQLTIDESFDPPIASPAFALGKGPRVAVDRRRAPVTIGAPLHEGKEALPRVGYGLRMGSRA